MADDNKSGVPPTEFQESLATEVSSDKFDDTLEEEVGLLFKDASKTPDGKLPKTALLESLTGVYERMGEKKAYSVSVRMPDQQDIDVFLMDFETENEDSMVEEEFEIFAKGMFATLAVATRMRVSSIQAFQD